MTDKDSLILDLQRNINVAKDELGYHFSEIKKLKSIINKNQLLINALDCCQQKIKFMEF